MPGRATQDSWFIVKSSDEMREEEMANQFSILAEKFMNSMKRQKYMTLEDDSARSEGVQYATGEKWKAITNSSRKNEETGPKRK